MKATTLNLEQFNKSDILIESFPALIGHQALNFSKNVRE
jgi:hypothetical protein